MSEKKLRAWLHFRTPVPMPSTPALGLVEICGGLKLQLVSPGAAIIIASDGDWEEGLAVSFETDVERFSEFELVKEGDNVKVWLDWEVYECEAVRPEKFPDPEASLGDLLGTVTIGRIDKGIGESVEILRKHRVKVIDDKLLFDDSGWVVVDGKKVGAVVRTESDIIVRDIEFIEGINWIVGQGAEPELLIYENGIAARVVAGHVAMAVSPAKVEEL